MNQEKSRRSNAKKARLLKQKKAMRKRVLIRFILSVCAVAVLVIVLLFSNKNITQANENDTYIPKTKLYKSVEVDAGETLWSIAKENICGEYRTVNDLIYEIKSINNISDEKIIAGEKLIIPYFE